MLKVSAGSLAVVSAGCLAVVSIMGSHVCRRLALPWEEHEVKVVSPVPLCLVQLSPFLHQMFQVSRV